MIEKFPYYIFEDLQSNQYFDKLVKEIETLQEKIKELEKLMQVLRDEQNH